MDSSEDEEGMKVYEELAEAMQALSRLGMVNTYNLAYENQIKLDAHYLMLQDRYRAAYKAKEDYLHRKSQKNA